MTNAITFTSNSFQKDQYRMGWEYSYRDMLMIRACYTYEKGIQYSQWYAENNNKESYRTTALRGPSAGFTFELPMSETTTFGIDYSYRHTDPFNGSTSPVIIFSNVLFPMPVFPNIETTSPFCILKLKLEKM